MEKNIFTLVKPRKTNIINNSTASDSANVPAYVSVSVCVCVFFFQEHFNCPRSNALFCVLAFILQKKITSAGDSGADLPAGQQDGKQQTNNS